jgi:hypothetical protein
VAVGNCDLADQQALEHQQPEQPFTIEHRLGVVLSARELDHVCDRVAAGDHELLLTQNRGEARVSIQQPDVSYAAVIKRLQDAGRVPAARQFHALRRR